MRLLDRFLHQPSSRRDPIAEYQPYYGLFSAMYSKPGTESIGPEFREYVEVGYKSNGIVFAVLLSRLMLFSEAEFKFQNLTSRKLYGTPELGLLETPWPNGTTGELLARMEQDASLAGNAFIRRASDTLLERLRPDLVDIILTNIDADPAPEVIGYVHWRNGRGAEPESYPVDEVAHWCPVPDPMAAWRGMSWLTPVVREVNADLSMTEYKTTYLDNAATPNLAVKYPMRLSPDAFAEVREKWEARYSGPSGAKTAILDAGADLTVVGNSMQQMDFTALQAAGENRIAAAAGVPGIVVGLKEGLQAATYSNYEQAMRRFADVTMRPLWRGAAAALAKLVTVPAGSRLWYDTTQIAALRQGEKDRAATAQVLAAAAMNLINAGYEPDTVTAALVAGDMSLLTHTGAIPTALYPEGKVPIQQGGSA